MMGTHRLTTIGIGYLGLIFGSALCHDPVMASNAAVLESQIKVLPFRDAAAIPSQRLAAKVTAVDTDIQMVGGWGKPTQQKEGWLKTV